MSLLNGLFGLRKNSNDSSSRINHNGVVSSFLKAVLRITTALMFSVGVGMSSYANAVSNASSPVEYDVEVDLLAFVQPTGSNIVSALERRAHYLWDTHAAEICAYPAKNDLRRSGLSSEAALCDISRPAISLVPLNSISRPNVLAGTYESNGSLNIFFVEEYYSLLSQTLIDQLLVEELAHAVHWEQNNAGYSKDLGAEISESLLGERVALKPADNKSEGWVDLEGDRFFARFASFTFPASYKVTNVAGKETNTHDFDTANDLGPVFFDDVSLVSAFSGNDISGELRFIESDSTVYGWMTRPIKIPGNTVR